MLTDEKTIAQAQLKEYSKKQATEISPKTRNPFRSARLPKIYAISQVRNPSKTPYIKYHNGHHIWCMFVSKKFLLQLIRLYFKLNQKELPQPTSFILTSFGSVTAYLNDRCVGLINGAKFLDFFTIAVITE